MKYDLLPHQFEAIQAINKAYNNRNQQVCGIVSIPTGGGKTYTAVYWLKSILEKSEVKIIWFAQSFELLNQAYGCMKDNLKSALNIRRVSSEKNHSRVSEIELSDNIILITTQSAIKNYSTENAYTSFVESNINNLVCVIDEAHHAPSYGFRKMIIELKERCTSLWLLGLTATPTYTNESSRGWLWKIFQNGVIYEVEKELLQQQGILAQENYIYIKTPTKIILNDEDYTLLVKKHREIPEHIIEELAENKDRNQFIIAEYVRNKKKYGKTIIFLDRWYQCEYMKDELRKYGVSCDVIYSFDNGRDKSNAEIISNFRKDKFDVLLNVRMLTEGADIPTVRTIFISHETQSYILFNQMIGRCLRGERAGGKKKEANIVLFGNRWNKSVAWYMPKENGKLSEERIERVSHPIYTFPIGILTELNQSLLGDDKYIDDYTNYVPFGWYLVRYIDFSFETDESIKRIDDYVIVLRGEIQAYEHLIDFLMNNQEYLINAWQMENFDEKAIEKQLQELGTKFFIDIKDEKGHDNVTKIARHIAQSGERPKFVKSDFNLDQAMSHIIKLIINKTPMEQVPILKLEYSRAGAIWPDIYHSFYNFKVAIDLNLNKFLLNHASENVIKVPLDENVEQIDEKELLTIVKQRDRVCKCCGIDGKKNKLFAKTIKESLGGYSIRNLQTLCTRCKKIAHGIDFNNSITILEVMKHFEGIKPDKSDTSSVAKVKSAIRGSINLMYECGAVFDVRFISIKELKVCEIMIFKGNPISWLKSQKGEILYYITNDLKQKKVIDLVIKIIQ